MRSILLMITIYLSFSAISCGPQYNPEYHFFNLLNQEIIDQKAYYPFLRFEPSAFYYSETKVVSENIKQWKNKFKKLSYTEIEALLLTHSELNFQEILKKSKLKPDSEIIKYILFARKIDKLKNETQNASWNYEVILGNKNYTNKNLLKDNYNALITCKDKDIKLRYLYQYIRQLHYSKNYEKAIAVFHQYKDKIAKSEMYYYTLDHVAGCYYSLKEYDKALIAFIKVFKHSKDRKQSAFTSYKFTVDNVKNSEALIKSEGLETMYLFLNTIRYASKSYETLEDLKYVDEDITQLLFMREVNNLERIKNRSLKGLSYNGMEDSKTFYENMNRLLSINKTLINSTKQKHFWKLTLSYLYFLQEDYDKAFETLSQLNYKPYDAIKSDLNWIYKIASTPIINEHNEDDFLHLLNINASIIDPYDYYYEYNSLQGFALQEIAHKYYMQGNLAKAFLCFNYITNLAQIGSIELLNNLELFINKPNKTKLEKELLIKTNKVENATHYIQYLKGLYFLQIEDYKQAKLCFKRGGKYALNKRVSNLVLSQNTKEKFYLPKTESMSDTLIKTSYFKNISDSLSFLTLSNCLIDLKNKSFNRNDNIAGSALLLLGNFNFNVSNTGLYRNLLFDFGAIQDYFYFGYLKNDLTHESKYKIKHKLGYNISNAYEYNYPQVNTAQIANRYYQQAFEKTKDRGLQLKLIYLQAKCELNNIYNNDDRKELKKSTPLNRRYKELIYAIRYDKENTQFQKEILKECSYLSMY